ncbi:1,4-alpha-glucan branching protein GlgB [Nitrosomonas sp. HPC101]|uniref:1,4-alpha-glucan branching protein GlgB n=1 Tax=Nitrosomonas sp. HPC101 TaxID=1658667 RepID=UPI001370E4A1|nr:1,4-alpha-glucan branching protein GlgB [Nitrosomonas sp. HPC101]MXS85708.1 1,4-alpha-glucan branching protein GlgB [Nitrosomonas sp. HPC101]
MKSLPFPSRDSAGDSMQSLLLAARLHDPGSFLGVHSVPDGQLARVFQPYMSRVWLQTSSGFQPMERVHDDGIFEWKGDNIVQPCLLRLENAETGVIEERHDLYAFPVQISGHDLYLFNEGRLLQAYHMLGAHPVRNQGIAGIRFAVWAPNAERVSVVGDFNRWDGRIHPMISRGASGVWELFIPDLPGGVLYKYEIRNRATGGILLKTDPYATHCELRPGTAALTPKENYYHWQDGDWMVRRKNLDWLHAPINIYELHAGSWKRHPDGRFYSYQELADHLIPYLQDMGYTYVELLPLSEHPLDESWGYQTTGYFAVTSRYGSPEAFMHFVDRCHRAGIGVILDWVPAHFPQDSFSLARFDGTALYEHADPRLGYHHDWGTYIFNYGRNEVKSFLLSSAHFWLSVYHLDGLRVDAVASMLYLDYSRDEGEWLPNRHGGRENLDAIDFLRELNVMVHGEFPGALTFAEESTSWPAVSRPAYLGGLGFSMKWNMGWMNDTLRYLQHDPVHRRFHHNELTFHQLYAYSENFVLPLSHDEVVHGKKSLLDKMPGDAWQKFANLRLLLTYQMTCPGKKINFMGNEFGQGREWRVGHELDWYLLARDQHRGIQGLMRDLNRLYLNTPALHELDFFPEGFVWIDCHDVEQSVISYQRRARDGSQVLVILNFTPVPRTSYRVGVPESRTYQEIFNSDSEHYGGSNTGNAGNLEPTGQSWSGWQDSVLITLPPLAGMILV